MYDCCKIIAGSYGAAVSIVCPGQETLDLQRIELSISASILPLPGTLKYFVYQIRVTPTNLIGFVLHVHEALLIVLASGLHVGKLKQLFTPFYSK